MFQENVGKISRKNLKKYQGNLKEPGNKVEEILIKFGENLNVNLREANFSAPQNPQSKVWLGKKMLTQ